MGEGHTSHGRHKASRWGREMHRGMTEKEDEESASERCFQLGDEVPRFVRAMTSETEKQNATGVKKKKSAMSFIRFGG